jgi:hypothetical protein
MSATLFFLIPVGLLAVTWSLCFVGCFLDTSGVPGTPYSNLVLSETSLVGYWPLNDFPGATPPPPAPPPTPPQNTTSLGGAIDLSKGGHTGGYFIPPAYPSGATVPAIASPTPTTGLLLRQGTIVPGDVSNSSAVDQNLLAASADFVGGYVSIPWAANSPQLLQFTIEAWVKPNWTAADNTGFLWVVFGAISPTAGFVLYINDKNNWTIAIGDGTKNNPIDTMVPAALKPSASMPAPITYVAVTFGSDSFLRLWINPQFGPGPDTNTPMPTPPNATWTSPNPVVYAAIDPTQQPLTFFIGAGYNEEAPRTQAGVNGAPLYPFQGQIQSVALYQAALDPSDLATHFNSGT